MGTHAIGKMNPKMTSGYRRAIERRARFAAEVHRRERLFKGWGREDAWTILASLRAKVEQTAEVFFNKDKKVYRQRVTDLTEPELRWAKVIAIHLGYTWGTDG